jgi:hypothetical protein
MAVTPLVTREFRYTFVIFTFVMFTLRSMYAPFR